MSAVVEYSQKIKFLMRYLELDRQINIKVDEVIRLRSLLEKISPILTDMPPVGSKMDIAESIAKIIDLEAEINTDIDEMIETKAGIEKTIENVRDERYKEILRLRYVKDYRLEKIAVEMNYNYRWIKRLHKKAVEKIKLAPQGPLDPVI